MQQHPPLPSITDSGFPDGTRVHVTGGRYAGDQGNVVNRAPDLRPDSVWVKMEVSGTHLVPAYRLTRVDDDADDSDEARQPPQR